MARQEKAQYFKISEYTNANRTTSWRVAGYMPDGTRIRQNFKEKAANLMRPSEIRDLKPEDVFKDKIRVSGGKLRRMLKRSVPISPVQEQMEMDRMRAGRRTTRNSGVGRPGQLAPYRENEVACD